MSCPTLVSLMSESGSDVLDSSDDDDTRDEQDEMSGAGAAAGMTLPLGMDERRSLAHRVGDKCAARVNARAFGNASPVREFVERVLFEASTTVAIATIDFKNAAPYAADGETQLPGPDHAVDADDEFPRNVQGNIDSWKIAARDFTRATPFD